MCLSVWRDCAARALLTTRQQWRLISLTAVSLTNLTSCLRGPLKCEVLQKPGITLSSAAGDFPGPGRGDRSTHDRVPICNFRHLYEQNMHNHSSHKAHLCQFWRKSVNMFNYGSTNIQLDRRTVRLRLCEAWSHVWGGGTTTPDIISGSKVTLILWSRQFPLIIRAFNNN